MELWIIEDEKDLRNLWIEISKSYDLSFKINIVAHWDECKAVPGDIVTHDMSGVGEPVFKEGISYFSFSGDHSKNVDLVKPFSFDDLIDFLLNISPEHA